LLLLRDRKWGRLIKVHPKKLVLISWNFFEVNNFSTKSTKI
jgi:hypothetical protein